MSAALPSSFVVTVVSGDDKSPATTTIRKALSRNGSGVSKIELSSLSSLSSGVSAGSEKPLRLRRQVIHAKGVILTDNTLTGKIKRTTVFL